MNNKSAMSIFAVAMLAYQAWRVFDYMSGNLVGVSQLVAVIVAVAFLGFSEIGLLVWLHKGRPYATTDAQETTATLLIYADFVGSMVLGLADLAKHNTLYMVDLSLIDPLLFFTPWLMVVLNLGGYLAYRMNDSEDLEEAEERKLRHEEVKTNVAIRREAIRMLRDNRAATAEKLAPHYFKDMQDRVTGRTVARFSKLAEQPQLTPRMPETTRKKISDTIKAKWALKRSLPLDELTVEPGGNGKHPL